MDEIRRLRHVQLGSLIFHVEFWGFLISRSWLSEGVGADQNGGVRLNYPIMYHHGFEDYIFCCIQLLPVFIYLFLGADKICISEIVTDNDKITLNNSAEHDRLTAEADM